MKRASWPIPAATSPAIAIAIAIAFAALGGAARGANTGTAPSGARPEGAPEYVAAVQPEDGRHLALTIHKLRAGFVPERPFLIWALGSSYTNMLGNGEPWREHIPALFPGAPSIEYRKMVGNSCPWQYLPGWARHLVIPDQPDLVLIYTIGTPDDLENTIVEIRRNSTADIIVPSIHWRERDEGLFGNSEDAADQDVGAVREICARHGVEFVENRRQWGEYLAINKLPISALLKDAVHQSDYGRDIINRNILAHLREPHAFSYSPEDREKRIALDAPPRPENPVKIEFTGNRIDLVGRRSPGGGSLQVRIDGLPANEVPAFFMTYVQPGKDNHKAPRVVPRDNAPHGVTLGRDVVPQTWTITVTSDAADYRIEGSVTGPDGNGNARAPFESLSGQIVIDPALWRRSEQNRRGDTFTFEVYRATTGEVSFDGAKGDLFRVHLARGLANGRHTLELVAAKPGDTPIEFLESFTPPLE